DSSGTTQIFKNLLRNADGTRTLCSGTTWTVLANGAGTNNQTWPETATGNSCASTVARPTDNGGPLLIDLTQTIDGAIGYADLGDYLADSAGLRLINMRNRTDTAYVSPLSGTGANCQITKALPGSTAASAVGLQGNGWAQDAAGFPPDTTW